MAEYIMASFKPSPQQNEPQYSLYLSKINTLPATKDTLETTQASISCQSIIPSRTCKNISNVSILQAPLKGDKKKKERKKQCSKICLSQPFFPKGMLDRNFRSQRTRKNQLIVKYPLLYWCLVGIIPPLQTTSSMQLALPCGIDHGTLQAPLDGSAFCHSLNRTFRRNPQVPQNPA